MCPASPPKFADRHPDPSPSACDLTWEQGHRRGDWLREGLTAAGRPSSHVTRGLVNGHEDGGADRGGVHTPRPPAVSREAGPPRGPPRRAGLRLPAPERGCRLPSPLSPKARGLGGGGRTRQPGISGTIIRVFPGPRKQRGRPAGDVGDPLRTVAVSCASFKVQRKGRGSKRGRNKLRGCWAEKHG